MLRCRAILLLSLLVWVEPASAQAESASAQKVYSLTVSIHAGVTSPLPPEKVEQILEKASDILRNDNNQNCNVKFELKGPIHPFTSGSARITDASTLEAVHRVPADVKVVQRIDFCVGQPPFFGCAWRPERRRKTVIVTVDALGFPGLLPVVWAHEFGHTTGLPHRNDVEDLALMRPTIKAFHTKINSDECRRFRAGPPSNS